MRPANILFVRMLLRSVKGVLTVVERWVDAADASEAIEVLERLGTPPVDARGLTPDPLIDPARVVDLRQRRRS